MQIESCDSTRIYVGTPELSHRDFTKFKELIREHCGIRMTDKKQLLLKNRIGKRLKALGMDSFAKYYEYVLTPAGRKDEMIHLWSVITTNQTNFFREPHHFEILRRKLIPAILAAKGNSGTIRVWSSGCSSGQEAYTLAAVVTDALIGYPNFNVQVLGTDIDVNMLEMAAGAVYPLEEAKTIPITYMRKYFDITGDTVIPKEQIRQTVSFKRINLRELSGVTGYFDVIFCRNVIMYFEQSFRKLLADFYFRKLYTPGYLFLGSSESFHGMPRIFKHNCFGKSIVYSKEHTPVEVTR